MIFVSSKPLTAPRPLPPHVLPPTPIHPTIPLLALLSVASSHHYEPVDPHILLLTSSPVILPTPLPHSPLPHESLPIVLRPRLCVPSFAVVVSPATCSLTHWPGLIMCYLLSVLYFLGFPVCSFHFVSYHLMYLVFRFSAPRSICPSSSRTCVSSPYLPTDPTTCFPFTPCRHPRSICTSMSQFVHMLTVRFDFLGTAIYSVQCASLYFSLCACICKCIPLCAF